MIKQQSNFKIRSIDTDRLRNNLRVIVVKDMFDFWIVLCSSRLALKFERTKTSYGENLYPWPPEAEHEVLRLARVHFETPYHSPDDLEEVFAIANREADRVREALGIDCDTSFIGDGI